MASFQKLFVNAALDERALLVKHRVSRSIYLNRGPYVLMPVRPGWRASIPILDLVSFLEQR